MIPRYEQEDITRIWSDEHKFETFLKVELALLSALEGDKIPPGTTEKIHKSVHINSQRIQEIEKATHHDVIAFCTSITEQLPTEIGKFFHFGATSSDIIDSAMSIQIKESLDLIIPALQELLSAVYHKAQETSDLLAMGRSHGMDAEPMIFGQKFLGHYAEFFRRYQDLQHFYQNELTIQLSGAVGNYTIVSPEVEEKAGQILGMPIEPVSTQVTPRDHLAKLISIHGLLAAAIERACVEIRHLSRSDVAEVSEGFKKGQKGSSTMPHKKNPIATENLTGISRLLRSHVQVALENIVLWHERDISHSSTERLYLPDNLALMLYSLRRLKEVIVNLEIHHDNIENKVKNNPNYLSSFYLHFLLEKTTLSRDEIYTFVQKAAFSGQGLRTSLQRFLAEAGHNVSLPESDFDQMKKFYQQHYQTISERIKTVSA
ncbi:MAG: adenylosuccinate lyase [Pseudomonadota bacterium]